MGAGEIFKTTLVKGSDMKTTRKRHWIGLSLFEIVSAGIIVDGLLIVWMFGLI